MRPRRQLPVPKPRCRIRAAPLCPCRSTPNQTNIAPIEATPPLTGDEAEELAASLEDVASPEEIERRQRAAREFFAAVTRPKTLRPHRDQGEP